MIGLSDLKELAAMIGVPATTVSIVVVAFQYGLVPSLTTSINQNVQSIDLKVSAFDSRMAQHDKELGYLFRQHTEQMWILTKALKEICLNTAKNETRSYKCAELDGTLSDKQ